MDYLSIVVVMYKASFVAWVSSLAYISSKRFYEFNNLKGVYLDSKVGSCSGELEALSRDSSHVSCFISQPWSTHCTHALSPYLLNEEINILLAQFQRVY